MDGARSKLVRFGGAGVLALALTGCGKHDEGPYPTWAEPTVAYVPTPGSPNAFDAYALAGERVERDAGAVLLTRTVFTPPLRRKAEQGCAAALSQIAQATAKSCTFPYLHQELGKPLPYRQGWRLIGRVMRWRIDDACAAGQYEKAIDQTAVATKFGLDLAGGSPEDASLGYVIAGDARRALAPFMPKMGAAQLRRLSGRIKAAYLARPRFTMCAENAGREMMQRVQDVQDAYVKNDYAQLEQVLGPDAKDPVAYLKGLHDSNPRKRIAFFEGFAEEARSTAAALRQADTLDLAAAEKLLTTVPKGERAWKRFARAFFGFGPALVTMTDAAEARTQMLVLDAEILRALKLSRQAPRNLNGFSKAFTVDPFTKRPLVYRSDGLDYLLYSAGEDLTDDGGDTDETFTRPDLKLER